MRALTGLLIGLFVISGCGGNERRPGPAERPSEALSREVAGVERSFAATMEARDLEAFSAFLDREAVFFSNNDVMRGREAVRKGWSRWFESDEAPFSWAPRRVEVLESGRLALSTGPVLDPDGSCIGTFTSIWRMNPAGRLADRFRPRKLEL